MGVPISFSPSFRLSVFRNIAPNVERNNIRQNHEIKQLHNEILVHLIAFEKFRQNSLFPSYSTKEEENFVLSLCFAPLKAFPKEVSPLLQKELKILLIQSTHSMSSL